MERATGSVARAVSIAAPKGDPGQTERASEPFGEASYKEKKAHLLRRIQEIEEALRQTEEKLRTCQQRAATAQESSVATESYADVGASRGPSAPVDSVLECRELADIVEQVLGDSRKAVAAAHERLAQHLPGTDQLDALEWETALVAGSTAVADLLVHKQEHAADHALQYWSDTMRSTVIVPSGTIAASGAAGVSPNVGARERHPSESLTSYPKDASLLTAERSVLMQVFRDLYRWHRKYARALRHQYDALTAAWRQRLRRAESQRDERERARTQYRDRYLFLAARSLDTSALSQQRTTVLADLDTYLFEIEMDGGTAGGRSRWSRNLAPIPDQEWLPCSTARYDGGSVLVKDAVAAYQEAQLVNPWTAWEQRIFIEKFLMYYKDFRTIASFLDFKTTADCVLFYFQNKLRLGLRGAFRTYQRLRRANVPVQLCFDADSVPFLVYASQPISLWVPASDTKTPAVAASSGVVGVLSAFERPWTEDELGLFYQGLSQFGTNFRAIASFLGTRTARECAEFFRMNRRRLGLDRYLPLQEREPEVSQLPEGEAAPTKGDGERDTSVHGKQAERRGNVAASTALEWSGSRGTAVAGSGRGSAFAIWTPEEEILFAEAFSELGADWRRLADRIPSKTPEQIYTYWQQQALSEARQSRRSRSGI